MSQLKRPSYDQRELHKRINRRNWLKTEIELCAEDGQLAISRYRDIQYTLYCQEIVEIIDKPKSLAEYLIYERTHQMADHEVYESIEPIKMEEYNYFVKDHGCEFAQWQK